VQIEPCDDHTVHHHFPTYQTFAFVLPTMLVLFVAVAIVVAVISFVALYQAIGWVWNKLC
jgi:hypothetical protein